MSALVGYLLLFVVVGVGFIFVHLILGKLIRPARPDPEKLTIYECGEPTVGSAWVQFDLRFYVVALLFVIFDVEVAFFFPWAVVFGKTNTVANPQTSAEERAAIVAGGTPAEEARFGQPLSPPYRETEEQRTQLRADLAGAQADPRTIDETRAAANQFGWIAFFDILVFFGVLLVGFAYLWARGDLEWVRSTAAERQKELAPATATTELVGAGREPVSY